jgi:5-methylcytosine-specific restriction endonuclease McrA
MITRIVIKEDKMNYPKTRAEAKASGATHYFTGVPCTRGHIALRKTKGSCIECMKEDWAIDNEKRKGKPKSEAAKAAGKKYYQKNRESVIARAAARPPAQKQAYRNVHKKNNPELYKALVSVRKRRHREATPPWITKEQKLQMRQMYLKAQRLTKLTGERYVVDHIVPLINDAVCGLHVPWNLRIMTQEENLKKSNKLLDFS